MLDRMKIAVVQMEPRLMKCRENLANIMRAAEQAAGKQAGLIVFPECCLTGYLFSSRQEALPFAETIPGPSTEKLVSLCQEFEVYLILGLLEKEGDRMFNALAFLGPSGLVGKYRKNHLPLLGVDRFVDRGDEPFQVFQTAVGNIGLQI